MIGFLSGAPLGRYCTFVAGGRAKRLAFAYKQEELAEAASEGALVIGRGSNILVGDAGYNGFAVINRTSGRNFGEDYCICDSGVLMSALAREYAESGRAGLEWAYGLPGTVGGAVVGNAGAFGSDMSKSLISVTVCDGGKYQTYSAEQCGFSYRSSGIRGTVLSAVLKAPKGDKAAIRELCEQNLKLRRDTQPRGASAGSVFKAAGPTPAGMLIELAGLKNTAVGGAEVSDKHANFIINRGGATSADILELINLVQTAVYDKFGVKLRREIKLIGDFF